MEELNSVYLDCQILDPGNHEHSIIDARRKGRGPRRVDTVQEASARQSRAIVYYIPLH